MWLVGTSSSPTPPHFRFLCEETVEARIQDLQRKKLELADGVLTGAKRSGANKLTLDDLKVLFNVNDPHRLPR